MNPEKIKIRKIVWVFDNTNKIELYYSYLGIEYSLIHEYQNDLFIKKFLNQLEVIQTKQAKKELRKERDFRFRRRPAFKYVESLDNLLHTLVLPGSPLHYPIWNKIQRQ